MKTHINQILTAVGFFSMSLTTTLVISWGMNGFMIDEAKTQEQCTDQKTTSAYLVHSKADKNYSFKLSNGIKLLIPKISLNSNGQ